MRIFVVGAYGLIGAYVVARLSSDGHDLTGAGREITAASRRFPEVRWVRADLRTTTVDEWRQALGQSDAVVNCAGALQNSPRDDLRAVHADGVRRLLEACGAAGVKRVVHVSAAGVAADRTTYFNATKLAGEAIVKNGGVDWTILRPGLVIAPSAYGGTALLRGLAAFPYFIPIVYPASIIQIVSVEDVAAAVARSLQADAPTRISVDLVHAERLTLGQLALELRRWLGLPKARALRLPAGLARVIAAGADGLAYLGWRSPMRTAALEQLRAGVQGDPDAAGRDLGLRLRSLREILSGAPSGIQERWFSRLYFLKPAVLAALFIFWLLSGLIALFVSPLEAAAVLARAGVPPSISAGAVISASLADIALAVAVIFRRTSAFALQGMLFFTLAYAVGGSILRPDLWSDPLAPLLKIIPAAFLTMTAMAILDER